MLVLPLKPGVKFDLMAALAKWLDSDDQHVSFTPTNPLEFVVPKPAFSSEACRNDLLRLQALRTSVMDVLLKPDAHTSALKEGGLEECQEYHAALLEFEKRGFPTVDDEMNGIRLVWNGAFSPQIEHHADLTWERAVIGYSVCALLSAKAAACCLSDRSECKEAVGYCQTAVGILGVLKSLVKGMDWSTVDLSHSMLSFWEAFLLAQAQMFVFRMASLAGDNAKHSTLVMLAQSAFDLFNKALTAAQDTHLESEVPRQSKEWAAFCKVSSMLHSAKAEYHQAVIHRVAGAWGLEIARLRVCLQKLEALKTFLRKSDTDSVDYMKRECLAITPVVHDRLEEAMEDNYKIYQDIIPTTTTELEGKQLAKEGSGLPEAMMIPKRAFFIGL